MASKALAKTSGRLPPIVTNKQTVQMMMQRMDRQLQDMLPNFINSRKLLAVLLSACQRQPILFQCSTRSFIGALLECAMVGLYPDGSLGHAWFVPFKDKRGQYHAQLIIGYKGYQTLALNTGQVSRIKAVAVHEGDEFTWREGTSPGIDHVPGKDVIRNANTLTHVYGYAKLIVTPDDPQFVVLTKPEIDSVMNRSKAGTRGPWGTDYVAMGRKTGINRVCNTLQLSPDLSRATTLDDMAASGINQRMGASPLLEQIGEDLQLPEPIDFDDDDGFEEAPSVPMPQAKGRGGKQDASKGQSGQDKPADPAPAQADAPVANEQEPSAAEMQDAAAPDSPDAAPQDAPGDNQGTADPSDGGLFPDAPAAQPKGRKRERAWKPTKRMIDKVQQDAQANDWTLDQLAEYTQEIFGCGLASLKSKADLDSLTAFVTENKP